MTVPLDELEAERPLEMPHLLRDRPLGQVEGLCRAREIGRPGDGDESTDLLGAEAQGRDEA